MTALLQLYENIIPRQRPIERTNEKRGARSRLVVVSDLFDLIMIHG